MQTNTPKNGASPREGAKELAQHAKEKAEGVASQVADTARTEIDQRFSQTKERAVEKIDHVASALRRTGEDLEDEGPVGSMLSNAADQVDRISQYLDGQDLGQIVGEVERFARREPILFLGGAFALGLLGARFLKSSRRHDHEAQMQRGRDEDAGDRTYATRGFDGRSNDAHEGARGYGGYGGYGFGGYDAYTASRTEPRGARTSYEEGARYAAERYDRPTRPDVNRGDPMERTARAPMPPMTLAGAPAPNVGTTNPSNPTGASTTSEPKPGIHVSTGASGTTSTFGNPGTTSSTATAPTPNVGGSVPGANANVGGIKTPGGTGGT